MGGLRNGDHHTPRGLEARRRDGTGRSSGRAGPRAAKFFRIGTGGTGGTYYPVGGMIANAISTDKINVSAVATNGSVANVNGIVGGSMESGFSQADVNAWAYTGTGIYEGKPKIEELRVIANLYPESVHVVVKKGAGDQVARRSQGQARLASTSRAPAPSSTPRALLAAYGVAEKDIKPEYLKQVQSRREVQGRHARRLLPDHRLSAGHADRARRHQRLRAAADRRRRGATRSWRSSSSSPRIRSRTASTRTSRASRPLRSAPSGPRRRSSPSRSRLRDHQGAVERQDARRDGRRPRQGQGDPEGDRAARASASRCMPAPRNSTRKPACEVSVGALPAIRAVRHGRVVRPSDRLARAYTLDSAIAMAATSAAMTMAISVAVKYPSSSDPLSQ